MAGKISEEILQGEKGARQQIELRQKEAQDVLDAYRDFEVESSEDYEVVAEGLKEVKRIAKDIEASRKKVTAPLNEALKEFRSWYQPALTILTNTEALLKKKLADYTSEQERKAREAMEAAAAASRAGDFDAAHEASKGIVEAPTAKGITVSTYYDYEIEDFDRIPRQFLAVDHSAVRLHMKNAGGQAPSEIPGIRFVQKKRTIARTG